MNQQRQRTKDATALPPGDVFARVQSAAHASDTSPYSRRQPTPAQLDANRYSLGRVSVHGLALRIENPHGTRREGVGADGRAWSNLMPSHYGDIEGTHGADGDPVDVFIGPLPERDVLWVVNQIDPGTGEFDEHKVMLGYASEQQARDAYACAYDRQWRGLKSIVKATVSQLKWWLKFGDKSRPFTPDVLPYESTSIMDKVLWNNQAQPVTKTLHAILYELRQEDAGHDLMVDAVSMADLMSDPDIEAVQVLDAMVVEVGRMQPKMEALQRIMATASELVKPTEMTISAPVRYRGVAQVMALFTMSDGQTVSIWFHNPDTTPAKLMPLDELISWKWMLNKKDVTIVVAPEKGRDLNPREVARRVMRLVERNSEAFQRANAKVAEKAAQLEALDTEIAELETELTDLQRQIEIAKVEKETRVVVVAAGDPHYSDRILKALMDAGWNAGYFEGAGETGQMVSVSREFVGVGTLGGMAVPDGMRRLFAGYSKDQAKRRYIALTLGDTQIADWDGRDQDPVEVARLVNEAAEKYADQARLKNGLPALYGVAAGDAPSFDDFLAAVVIELSTKGNMSAADAKKLTDDEVTNLVRDGFDDKTPAEQVADQILAANKRSPAVERAYAIAGILMTQYGWSKSDENEYPETGIFVDSPRGMNWVKLWADGVELRIDKSRSLLANPSVDESVEAIAASLDAGDARAAEASKPVPDPAPEPNQNPEPTSESTPEPTDAEKVDAAYKFANASDAFKSAVVGSIGQESYSPFLSAKNIDEAAKKHGATVTWRLAMVLDSVGDSEYDENPDGEDEDFDVEAEFDACPDGDDAVLDALILDGDHPGHAFRGNQHVSASGESRSAVRSSQRAKHAEKHGDPKAQKKAHKTAYFSHMAAAEEAKGVTRSYHRKMAKFHGGRAGVVMDSASVFDDASGGYESIVGVIKNGAQVVGRAQVGGDGKAMIFTGESGGTRVKYLSKVDGALRDFMWSDDDVVDMVDALFTVPENGVAEPATVTPTAVTPPAAESEVAKLNALSKLVSKDAIRSDDPQAIEKLQAKMNYLTAYGEMMRKANKLVRKQDRAGLAAMGFSGAVLEGLFKPDFAGRTGFADYMMSNNNAEVRRTRIRLEELMAAATPVTPPAPAPVVPAPTPDTVPAPTPVAPPPTQVDPQKSADTDYLNSMIDGTANLLAPDVLEKLEPMFDKYAADAEMMGLLERAANAYGDAAVAAAKQALAA